ncbi:protein PIN-LIKES 7-like isoform X2 [Wolffia australiana]
MVVNIGMTFVIGGALGWIVVTIVRPEADLRGPVMAVCSAGNLGNLMLVLLPAICNESLSPFGETDVCRARGLSYASFSMALGCFYLWTITHSLMRSAYEIQKKKLVAASVEEGAIDAAPLLPTAASSSGLLEGEIAEVEERSFIKRVTEVVVQFFMQFKSPPAAGALTGLLFGASPWLKSLIIGPTAPFRAVYDSISLMGQGTIPCITVILGGNLTQGVRKSRVSLSIILAVLVVKFIFLPAAGIAITEAASRLGFLPVDPLFRYALLLQYTLPPAMAIGTMAQLFDVAREECAVLFLWSYLLAAPALTLWSSVYLWILS